MSIETSLAVRSFNLRPWHRDPAFRMFTRHPFDGLLDLRADVELIAIFGDKPGSGKLAQFFDELEAAADENELTVSVLQIWNNRLAAWLKRRGYEVARSRPLGLHARRPIMVAENPIRLHSRIQLDSR